MSSMLLDSPVMDFSNNLDVKDISGKKNTGNEDSDLSFSKSYDEAEKQVKKSRKRDDTSEKSTDTDNRRVENRNAEKSDSPATENEQTKKSESVTKTEPGTANKTEPATAANESSESVAEATSKTVVNTVEPTGPEVELLLTTDQLAKNDQTNHLIATDESLVITPVEQWSPSIEAVATQNLPDADKKIIADTSTQLNVQNSVINPQAQTSTIPVSGTAVKSSVDESLALKANKAQQSMLKQDSQMIPETESSEELTVELKSKIPLANAVEKSLGSNSEKSDSNAKSPLLQSAAASNSQKEFIAKGLENIINANLGNADSEASDSSLKATRSYNAMVETVTSAAQSPNNQQSNMLKNEMANVPVVIRFGQAQFNQQLAERVSQMAFNNVQNADIQLDPPELGPLGVRVATHNEQTVVTFVSSNPAVREQLEQNSARLKEMFEEQGLDLVDVDVADQQETAEQEDSSSEAGNNVVDNDIESEESDKILTVSVDNGIDQFV